MNFLALVTCLLAGIAIVTAFVAARIKHAPLGKRSSARERWFYWMYTFALVVVLLTTSGIWLGFSFVSNALNFCAVGAATLAYCYLSFASFAVRPRLLGIVAGAVLTAPVILAVATLPITGLALAFILHDVNVPYVQTTTSDGMICRTQEDGMAASDEEREVQLLRPVGRIAYRKVFAMAISYRVSSGGTHSELCAFASSRLRLSSE